MVNEPAVTVNPPELTVNLSPDVIVEVDVNVVTLVPCNDVVPELTVNPPEVAMEPAPLILVLFVIVPVMSHPPLVIVNLLAVFMLPAK